MESPDPIPPSLNDPPTEKGPKLSPRQNPHKSQDLLAAPVKGGLPAGKVELPRLSRSPSQAPLTPPPEAIELPRRFRTVPGLAAQTPKFEAIRLKDYIPIHKRSEFRSLCALVVVLGVAGTGTALFLKRHAKPVAQSPAETLVVEATGDDSSAAGIDESPVPGQDILRQLATASQFGNVQTFEALVGGALTAPAASDLRFLAELARGYRSFLLSVDLGPGQRMRLLQPVVDALSKAAGDDATKLETAGTCLLELGLNNEAATLLEQAAAAAPGRLSTLRTFATALVAQGERRRAVKVLRELTEARPGNIPARLALAALYEEIDDAGSAISAYEAVLRIDPDHVGALDRKLELLRVSGRVHEALEASTENLARHGETPRILMRRGEALLAAGRFGDARTTLERARDLTTDPATLEVGFYQNLGLAYLQVGAGTDAERAFRKAIERDPAGSHAAQNNLAFLLLRDRRTLKEARELAMSASDQRPNDPDYADTYGLALFLTGEPARARDQINRAIKLSQRPHPDYYEHLGDAEQALGNLAAASAAWQRALALDPNRTHLKPRIEP